MTEADRTRERLIETYRRKAAHYDVTSRLSPVPGYPQHGQRLLAVRALGLHAGATVVDLACGTGLNFALLERAIGPRGRIVGVDLTDAMLARAERRVEAAGWSNVRLVQADAAGFDFPTGVDAVLSTYALTQVPDRGLVIAHAAAALGPGGRLAVLDLKIPSVTPRWLSRLGVAVVGVGSSASLDEWIARRPWEEIRMAARSSLAETSWAELCFGTAFLVSGRVRG
ncbi:methyltransferase domain-containing protein [Leifsonia shinshuensis]|uniref:class I SAM-dependent methyltransferase n=1 Tax=Leifsonia shinshuensis TaxID=150026 RepID=UPI001F50E63C|nr:methyltransferase domain-containing protein [Leifsonia shinshuensis]MCI0158906.1 methyltransferase domain-containing protein [Leifsonia shinshuensis]